MMKMEINKIFYKMICSMKNSLNVNKKYSSTKKDNDDGGGNSENKLFLSNYKK